MEDIEVMANGLPPDELKRVKAWLRSEGLTPPVTKARDPWKDQPRVPAGSPEGGQFGEGGGGATAEGGGGGAEAKPSTEEGRAISDYSSERAWIWTHYLRTGEKEGVVGGPGLGYIGISMNEQDYEKMKQLDNYLSRQSWPRASDVYRGVDEKTIKAYDELKHGDIVIDKGYMSTSTDRGIAKEFAGTSGGLMRIQVPKGAKGADITKHSESPNQKEAVFARDTRLRFIGKDRNGVYGFRIE